MFLEQPRRTVASLFLKIRLKTGLTLTTAGRQGPLAIPFTKIGGRAAHHLRIRHTGTIRLLDQRHLFAGWGCFEMREVYRDLRTGDVVDFDGQ